MIKSIALLGAALVTAATGCAPMCQSPWDYCNAVKGPCGGPNCNFIARYNSRFAPMYDTATTESLEPTPAEEPQPTDESQVPAAPIRPTPRAGAFAR